ncbi:DUF6614 family protein [Roseovarius sp.]|jgi:hypothetical protein
MTTYICLIDLRDTAKALSFAAALDAWMSHLKAQGVIRSWRLKRRKLNLASQCFRDFLLEIDVTDLAQLEQAFRFAGRRDDDTARLYAMVHDHVGQADMALYRPFPDPERAERVALI